MALARSLSMRQFTPRQLKQYLAESSPPPLLLDVRERWEYEIAHIEGSTLVPLAQVPGLVHREDPEREIVIICHHGVRSHHAGLFLEHHGFARVINLAGGIDAWAREVDPDLALY
jgi:rhodanese-related sulfurtransferase